MSTAIVVAESAALVSSAAPLTKHTVTAQEAASFTDAEQFFDDNGPVIDELRNRVFRSYRQSLPFFIKFHDLIEARPRDGKNRLITPLCGKYTYAEIIEDVTGKKAVTVRAALQEFKMSPALKDKRKADLRKKRHAKLVAVEQDKKDEVKTAHAVAEEAVAGRKVAVEAARNEGFAEGVAAKQAHTVKCDVQFVMYVLRNEDGEYFPPQVKKNDRKRLVLATMFPSLEKALAQQVKSKSNGTSEYAYTLLKLKASCTLTPCNPPDEPSPVKKSKKEMRELAAKNLADNTAARMKCMKAINDAAESFVIPACVDCGSALVLPVDGIKHGRIDQCEECGLKVETETVIGVPVTDGKSDYSIEIGLPSEGYGESLKHSQKRLA